MEGELGARAGPAVGATEAGEVSRRRQQLFEEREALSELESRYRARFQTTLVYLQPA